LGGLMYKLLLLIPILSGCSVPMSKHVWIAPGKTAYVYYATDYGKTMTVEITAPKLDGTDPVVEDSEALDVDIK